MSRKDLFLEVMNGNPRIVQEIHKENQFNTCDECDCPPAGFVWVYWKDDYQMCLNCFTLLSNAWSSIVLAEERQKHSSVVLRGAE